MRDLAETAVACAAAVGVVLVLIAVPAVIATALPFGMTFQAATEILKLAGVFLLCFFLAYPLARYLGAAPGVE